MRLARPQFAKSIELRIFYVQLASVLVQEETDLRCGGRITQKQSILDNIIKLEVFDRLERAPYLLPTARYIRPVHDVDKSAFQVGCSYRDACAFIMLKAEQLCRAPTNCFGDKDRDELVGAEQDRL